jgi:hypothetical protein
LKLLNGPENLYKFEKFIKFYNISQLKKFFSGPSDPKGSIFGPVGLCQIFRPFGLGLGILFSKKPEPEPDPLLS